MRNELEIYVHIPFCVRKCAYCDFLSGPADLQVKTEYVEALIKEIFTCPKRGVPELDAQEKYVVTTVFFGGGTPSVLEGESIERIMEAIRDSFEMAEDAEVTIEANPGTVTRDKLEAYRRAGINRISFGLQSTDNEALKTLGRIHTYEDFLESYRFARECGFDNINVDLISATPRQTIASWEEDLKHVVTLEPEHISAYSLIIEEGTPFAKLYGEGAEREYELPTEEDERLMYYKTEEILEAAGYHHYEISNYARPGKECKHNLGYWERKNYLGFGLGASSLMDNVRFQNTDNLKEYLKNSENLQSLREDIEHLSLVEQMEETIFLGLRKLKGVSIEEIRDQYGTIFEIRYGDNVKRMEKEGLIAVENGYFRLTKKGIDVSNYVFAEVLR